MSSHLFPGVSLWSGDVQLKNLELKLDVLEQEFLFPVKFLSGRVHELNIHVPWTSLGSDSVVITLNTLECTLTYKDLTENDGAPPSAAGIFTCNRDCDWTKYVNKHMNSYTTQE